MKRLNPTELQVLGRILKVTTVLLIAIGAGALLESQAWLVTFVAGLGFLAYGTMRLHEALGVRHWPRTTAKVIGSRVDAGAESARYGPLVFHYPVVTFEYEWQGVRYTAEAVSAFTEDYRSYEPIDAERLARHYMPGQEMMVFVSPRNPARAAVVADPSPRLRSHFLALIVGGLLLAGISGALAVFVASR